MSGTLAIDLGSSTTVVAWQDHQGPPGLLPLPPYSCGDPCVVPSLLWLEAPDAERPLIGRQVLEAALADGDHPGLCRDFKRQIGAPATGASAGWLSAERAGTLLLEGLWRALPAELVPERLVLTAPIETYRGYRSWLERACRDLAVPELALVD
ncbi:Hsp70 family protein, partial [Synechococcus sp. BA-120 BA3]|nr:Hsp70 family protein [Synechococcus sp. BA-120 BA3]